MAEFTGVVSIFEKNGAVEIRRVSSGGYSADEVSDLVSDLLETKKPVSKWSLWIDGFDVKPAETYSASTLTKLIKVGTVELIACKCNGRNGRFTAPRIKITAPGSVKAPQNKARIGR